MLFYPQISGSGVAQYPLVKTIRHRSISAATPGGRVHRSADPAARQVSWDLTYTNLTEVESQRLESFFASVEGRLKGFTFLDPASNLLGWTEELAHASWQKGPLLAVSPGVEDAMGGDRGTSLVNGAQGEQPVVQTLPVAPGMTYCFSVWMKCGAGTDVSLVTGDQRRRVNTAGGWRREMFNAVPVSGDDVAFGVVLGAGAAATVFAPQVEAQLGASEYKRNPGAGGVYTNARFDQDELLMTCDGPDQFGAQVRVVAGRQE